MQSQPQVLVVTSDPDRSRVLSSLLVACGLEFVAKSSIREASVFLAQSSVPLVFCENELPDGGFGDLLQAISPARIPLVVASRIADTRLYIEAMSRGAFDFIAPPFHRHEVERIISNALRRPVTSVRSGEMVTASAAAR